MILEDIKETIYRENLLNRFWPPQFILISYNLLDDFIDEFSDKFIYVNNYEKPKREIIKESLLSGRSKYMGLTIKVLNEKDLMSHGYYVL